MIPIVDIGIACSSHQTPGWWSPMLTNLLRESNRGNFQLGQLFAVQSAMPDFNKNNTVGGVITDPSLKGRNEKTDVNRQVITGYFLEGGESGIKADYIFWNDDDTVFPDGAISKMLRLEKPFVAGLYFNTNKPKNPIAYTRAEVGAYRHLWGWEPGSILEVDVVGMGCTLIHRSVYEKIMEEHEVFMRPNYTVVPIHKSKILSEEFIIPDDMTGSECVVDGYYVAKLEKPDPESQRKLFPFYVMEQGRTEDMWFCELAANVGIRPWVDTSIVCEHWKPAPTTYEDYRHEYVKDTFDTETEED